MHNNNITHELTHVPLFFIHQLIANPITIIGTTVVVLRPVGVHPGLHLVLHPVNAVLLPVDVVRQRPVIVLCPGLHLLLHPMNAVRPRPVIVLCPVGVLHPVNVLHLMDTAELVEPDLNPQAMIIVLEAVIVPPTILHIVVEEEVEEAAVVHRLSGLHDQALEGEVENIIQVSGFCICMRKMKDLT